MLNFILPSLLADNKYGNLGFTKWIVQIDRGLLFWFFLDFLSGSTYQRKNKAQDRPDSPDLNTEADLPSLTFGKWNDDFPNQQEKPHNRAHDSNNFRFMLNEKISTDNGDSTNQDEPNRGIPDIFVR